MSRTIKEAYHPGSYLNDYLEEAQLTQDEFAKRLGITSKQVSLLLKEKANVTPDIAYKLSALMGTSPEVWLNLQSRFDAYLMELQAEENFQKEKDIYDVIDKSFLRTVGVIKEEDTVEECISKLRQSVMVSNLEILKTQDFASSFNSYKNMQENERNLICKNVWISIATKHAKLQEVKPFDENKLRSYIMYFRSLTLLEPFVFYPILKEKLNECGVAFIVLPTLRESDINGVVRWIGNDKVMIAMNNRGKTNDIFWFNFFHELKIVLQKMKRKPVYEFENFVLENNNEIEDDADNFASETLIEKSALNELVYPTRDNILLFAKEHEISPGIVVGLLQKNNKLDKNSFNDLKTNFEITNY